MSDPNRPLEMKITCAKCEKLVDYWEVRLNEADRCREVFVRCHGDTDICKVYDHDLAQAGPHMDWTTGTAFRTDRIENKPLGDLHGEAAETENQLDCA